MNKDKTLKTYESTASEYVQNVAELHPEVQAEQFLHLLNHRGKIIDLGCGSGRDAHIFTEKGLEVIGVDFSPKMIEFAKKQAPKATFYVMDLEQLDFPENQFDGAWSNAALLHLPKKNIPPVLSAIHRILKPEGLFFLQVKLGEGERIEKDHRYGGLEKYWSYFQEGELDSWLIYAGFHLLKQFIYEKRSSYETHEYLNIFCRK